MVENRSPKPAPDSQQFVYGINPIRELLESHAQELQEILLARDRRDPRIIPLLELAAHHQLPVHNRPTDVLTRLSGNEHHQGIVAAVKPFHYADIELIEARIRQAQNGWIVLLDGVQDPGNLGALIRTAYLLGAVGIVIPQERAAGVTPAARKASAGADAHLPIARVVNLARTMESLFEQLGVWMVGLDQGAERDVSTLDLDIPLGLVLGSEGKGLRPVVRKHCHLLGKIPMALTTPTLSSLSVSAAGAIAMYEVKRQRSNRAS